MLDIFFRHDIIIPIARDKEVFFEVTDTDDLAIDFTLYNVTAQLRAGRSTSSALLSAWTVAKDANGNLTLTLTDTVTSGLAFTPQNAFYDVMVEEIASGLKKTWIYGNAKIVGSVTPNA